MVHRVTVGWCNGGRCGGRMYYPKADYLEKVKAITSYFRKEMANMWWSIGGGIIIFALGMFIFLKPGLICPIWNYYDYASIYFGVTISSL